MIKNYKIIKSLITDEETELLKLWCQIKHRINFDEFDYDQSDNADTMIYGNAITDALMIKLTPTISKHSSLNLLPTYSFTRIYTKFGDLKKHTDRPSCELSATVHIGSDGTEWPIFMGGESVLLEPGDGIIYKGTEIPHWREEFLGDWYAQIFLHWVNADGQYKDYYKDQRFFFGMKGTK